MSRVFYGFIFGIHFKSRVNNASITRNYSAKWRNSLYSVVSPNNVLKEPAILFGNSRDQTSSNSPHLKKLLKDALPLNLPNESVLVRPDSVSDLVDVVRYAASHRINLLCRGQGTGISAGAYNFNAGLILHFSPFFNRILEVDSSRGTVTCQAGAKISQIRETVLNLGWDLRLYPTTCSTQDPTIAGYLQSCKWGLGSLQYGSILDAGNIIELNVIPIHSEQEIAAEQRLVNITPHQSISSPMCSGEKSNYSDLIPGILHTYGTTGIISEVTLALTPALYWVDMAISFNEFNFAFKWIRKMLLHPGLTVRELAILPSSMITQSMNQGEKGINFNMFKNRIPHVNEDHCTGDCNNFLESVSHNTINSTPMKECPTQAVIILSLNESAMHYFTHQARLCGGHTIYLEHNRGGFGLIERFLWQETAPRLFRHVGHGSCPYGFLEFVFSPDMLEDIQTTMRRIEIMINECSQESIVTTVNSITTQIDDFTLSSHKSQYFNSQSHGSHLQFDCAWRIELAKMNHNLVFGAIAQVIFPFPSSLDASGLFLDKICHRIQKYQAKRMLFDVLNPNAINPDQIDMQETSNLPQGEVPRSVLRARAKQAFDPHRLLNVKPNYICSSSCD